MGGRLVMDVLPLKKKGAAANMRVRIASSILGRKPDS
jgi:hypothetical protein